MREFKIDEWLMKSFKNPTETTAAQYFSTDSRGTSSGHQRASVRHVSSPVLLNLFLEKIMQETLHDHHTVCLTFCV
ncbi:hypothetical protein DPMN_169443 [Dreissena polymorpha]|uniref:Uncharacterized protein n=1 Tax=Dreissena polymorpha TaxID=45954 RepID=A0A9D4IAN0_DREPO|nr:hypothetical protein DPMN_169443 [Dreissena polymorpha]